MPAMIQCINCGNGYPEKGIPYLCDKCGGIFEFSNQPILNLAQVERSQPGIWKYAHTFGLPKDCEPVSLGEGETPLVWANIFQRKIAFKCEFQNPSGSFKDRGSSVIVGLLKSRGIHQAVEDSSGNAGASFAAYATRAGIQAEIFIPESASGPKRRQISAYGAVLTTIAGSRSDVTLAARKKVNTDRVYASHAYLPLNVPGYATAAYETYEQLGEKMPGAVIVPAGQGGFLHGLLFGFNQLRIATNRSLPLPMMIGVQISSCNPLMELFVNGKINPEKRKSITTLAEGVNVQNPVRGNEVIKTIKSSGGKIYEVTEKTILPGMDSLARLGFYIEPTSALVWPILEEHIDDLPDPVVVILTGSGFKHG
jgi:threonine synthase